jgi:hypothetical protein
VVDQHRRRRRGGWLLVALIVAILCAARSGSAESEVAATRSEDRVIFDREATRRLEPHMGDGEPWTPSLADVVALERKLPGYLRREWKARSATPLWKRAPGYKRQYFGITRKGAHVVYAHFFCDAMGSDWHTVEVDAFDGGDCYFSVEYDVKTGRFHDLVVNGEA